MYSSPKLQEKVLDAKDIDTTVTGRATGHPVRVLKNIARKFHMLEKECAALNKYEELGRGLCQEQLKMEI